MIPSKIGKTPSSLNLKPTISISLPSYHGISFFLLAPFFPQTLHFQFYPALINDLDLSCPKRWAQTCCPTNVLQKQSPFLFHNRSTRMPYLCCHLHFPFFNSLQYDHYLLMQYSQLGLLFDLFIPLLGLYQAVPYANFVAFFALYLGIVRNPSFSYYVRFNAMHTLTLDVLLVVSLLLTQIFNLGQVEIGFKLMIWGHKAMFVFSCFCLVYRLIFSLLGKVPYLPLLADANRRQL